MNKIRVVVVDDSLFMRKAMERMLAGEPDIEVVGYGENGREAIDLAAKLKPDVMTLDIEMPVMDGLTALEKIMKSTPIPVIMVSSLTQEGADVTLKALDMGAADFIPKEKSFGSVGILKITNELKAKVRRFGTDKSIIRRLVPQSLSLLGRPIPTLASAASRPRVTLPSGIGKKKIVALGTSTGGPQSLQKVIPVLPADLGVPVLIVQHMPPNFTASLANRLNSMSHMRVVEAQGGEQLEPNCVYIAKGGTQMRVKRGPRGNFIETGPEMPGLLHNPSVDVMVESVAELYGKDALGVIMTGMGNDGEKGMANLKSRGGTVISQDEESCIVYGMPRAVAEAKLSDEVVTLGDIAGRIEYYCK